MRTLAELSLIFSDRLFELDANVTNNRALRFAIQDIRRLGTRIVLTNGCWDLLHPGHVLSLFLCSQMRKQNVSVVVGLNTSESVTRLKGPGRPIYSLEDRAFMLLSLRWVDLVVIFDGDMEKLAEVVCPDILVKGGDYRGRELAGAARVRRQGGEVVLTECHFGYSTTSLIARIAGLKNAFEEPASEQDSGGGHL